MKDTDDALDGGHFPSGLTELGTFEWPRSEVRQTLGHLIEKFRTSFFGGDTPDAVDVDELQSFSDEKFGISVREKLASVLQAQLDHTYLDWLDTPESLLSFRAFVTAPMKEQPLKDWAERHGFPTLNINGKLEELDGSRCVVVPNLEAFVSRDHAKMGALTEFFASFSKFDGKVIVGCNSWAWLFLKQFDDAHLLFDDAQTIPAFDADALSSLFGTDAPENDRTRTIKAVASGKSILARNDDDALTDPYLEALAGLSLGLPWVAIEMFFNGIAQNSEDETDQSDDSVWANLPTGCSLPPDSSDALLFALHTLLIHGPRSTEELTKLLPHRTPNGLWSDLARRGFIEIHGGKVHCAIRNYPDIRNELGAAGFNLDTL